MYLVIAPSAALAGIGLFLILSSALKVPTLDTTKAVVAVTRRAARRARSAEAVIHALSVKLAPFVPLGDYRKRRMASTLRLAGINMSPQAYAAQAIVKSGIVFLTAFLCLAVVPLLAPVSVVLAVAMFFRDINAAEAIVRQKRESIESELPRFVNTLMQELSVSRDVLSILESYRNYAGAAFRSELEIVVADMRSGSHETALTRFEARIGSAVLSEVVRGLVSVMRGDSGLFYFQMLVRDLKQLELQKLKMIALKRPGKIKKYSFLMLAGILAMYFTVILVQGIKTFGKLL